jgi:hypothetical protein
VVIVKCENFPFQVGEEDSRHFVGPHIGSQSQTSLMNSTTFDSWLRFNDWHTCLPPEVPESFRLLASYYSDNRSGKRILLLTLSNLLPFGTDTWSHSFETNSWSLIEHSLRGHVPQLLTSSIVVTVCQSKVLHIVGRGRGNSSVWLFDGETNTWSERILESDRAPSITLTERAFLCRNTKQNCKDLDTM